MGYLGETKLFKESAAFTSYLRELYLRRFKEEHGYKSNRKEIL